MLRKISLCSDIQIFHKRTEFAKNGHIGIRKQKQKYPAIKYHPSAYWTWNLSHSELMFSFVFAPLQCLDISKRRASDPNGWGPRFNDQWVTFFLLNLFCFPMVKVLMPILPISAISWKTRLRKIHDDDHWVNIGNHVLLGYDSVLTLCLLKTIM